jgi:PAS domain S-box-containing protein
LAHGQAFGVMAVRDYFNETAYGENEKQILTFVGEQTAQAINRKRAEQALRESEEKFRALYEASSQGVILHDEHQMLEVNPACLRILGFSNATEMIGKHPADTSAPIQPNGERADVLARKYIDECMTLGTARFDWLARNSGGKEVPIEIVLTRIQWGGRQLIQAVFNDISERKRAEAELLRTLAREKELNQLKSNFVSMVSHEFRTPLGIIQSSAEILSDYLDQLQPAERREDGFQTGSSGFSHLLPSGGR